MELMYRRFVSDPFAIAQYTRFVDEIIESAERGEAVLWHCTAGKDRAGFVSAVIEALMGASADEITADYMVTFFNYYGVQPGTEQYDIIASSNIQKSLAAAFGMESLSSGNLQESCVSYLESIGLTADEIAGVQAKLAD